MTLMFHILISAIFCLFVSLILCRHKKILTENMLKNTHFGGKRMEKTISLTSDSGKTGEPLVK